MNMTQQLQVRKRHANQIRIVLADDHAVLRAGLTALLNAEADMTVVGEAGDGLACIAVAKAEQPDVICSISTCHR